MFGCEHFHDYLYGQHEIAVESGHKPLVPILQNPIHETPLCLQKMILRIKPYAVKAKYLPDRHLVLAELTYCPSRAYLPIKNAHQCKKFKIHLLDFEELSETMFQKLTDETKRDPELQQLH